MVRIDLTVTVLLSESSGLSLDSLCCVLLQRFKGRNGYWQGTFICPQRLGHFAPSEQHDYVRVVKEQFIVYGV